MNYQLYIGRALKIQGEYVVIAQQKQYMIDIYTTCIQYYKILTYVGLRPTEQLSGLVSLETFQHL